MTTKPQTAQAPSSDREGTPRDAARPSEQLIAFDANDYAILRLTAHQAAGLENFEAIKDMLLDRLNKKRTNSFGRRSPLD